MMKRLILTLSSTFVLACSLLLASCGAEEQTKDAMGVFEATEVVVSAKTSGELLAFSIEEGDTVSAGSRVGLIDTEDLRYQGDQLRAADKQLVASKQQVASGKSATSARVLELEKQVAAARQQIANLHKEQARFQGLVEKGAAPQKQVDDIVQQISVLEKEVEAAREKIDASNRSLGEQQSGYDAQISSLEAQREGVSAQLSGVGVKIGKGTVSSPISGVVLQTYAEQGEFAQAGKPLFKVADLSRMTLRVYVTADQYNQLRLGQRVSVLVDDAGGASRRYTGTVSWIAQQAEFTPKTIQTKDERANLVYAVKIAVPNDGFIKIGQYGEVIFK